MCDYYTSSVGKWDAQKSGSPLDHSKDTNRFSFHTDNDIDAFLNIKLPIKINYANIHVRFREGYNHRILPLDIFPRSNSNSWQLVNTIDEVQLNSSVFEVSECDTIRFIKRGLGHLYLAGVDILVDEEVFSQIQKSLSEKSKFFYVYSPIYGLGGALSVCASALAGVDHHHINYVVRDKSCNGLIYYPPELALTEHNVSLLEDGLGHNLTSQICGEKPKEVGQKPLFQWRVNKNQHNQTPDIVLVSRDSLSSFENKDENPYLSKQRLYQRIIPSVNVKNKCKNLLCSLNLEQEDMEKFLGAHIRHGNGELYYSAKNNVWGVKPPAPKLYIEQLRKIISQYHIKDLLLCSDSYCVKELIEKEFPDLRIKFLSLGIQKLGAGCNHIAKVFDETIERTPIKRSEDDISSFAEILALSKCGYLFGGKSFFYEAIIGFSSVKPEHIFQMNNTDRYISLPNTYDPIAKAEANSFAKVLFDKFKQNSIHTDGVFFNSDKDKKMTLTYFDDVIITGNQDNLLDEISSGKVKQILKHLRHY